MGLMGVVADAVLAAGGEAREQYRRLFLVSASIEGLLGALARHEPPPPIVLRPPPE